MDTNTMTIIIIGIIAVVIVIGFIIFRKKVNLTIEHNRSKFGFQGENNPDSQSGTRSQSTVMRGIMRNLNIFGKSEYKNQGKGNIDENVNLFGESHYENNDVPARPKKVKK